MRYAEWQKRPVYLAKEAYSGAKEAYSGAKEACVSGKRGLCTHMYTWDLRTASTRCCRRLRPVIAGVAGLQGLQGLGLGCRIHRPLVTLWLHKKASFAALAAYIGLF